MTTRGPSRLTQTPSAVRWPGVAALTLMAVILAVPAFADSVRVVVDRANIWSTATVPIVLAVVRTGTVLEVKGRRDVWYLVALPNDPTQVGYIFARQVELVSGEAIAPQTPGGQVRTPPVSPRVRGTPPRPFLYANAAYQFTALHFDNSESFTTFLEEGTRSTAYHVTSGLGFDVGSGTGVARRIAVAAAVSWRTRKDDASVTEQVPHPFFYNQPRSLGGTAAGLERQEAALHLQVAWVLPLASHLQVLVAGGPSIFHVKQPLVSGVAYTDTYPYDTISFVSASPDAQSKSRIGANGQVDVVVPLTQHYGLQGIVRFSHASIKFDSVGSTTFSVPVGGVQAGLGLRTLF